MTELVRAPATYDFGHVYRGRALIIVNKNFCSHKVPKPKLRRPGASLDMKKMKDLFKALDFKVSIVKDLTAEKMKKKISKASTDEINMKCDCFALVISSHGNEVKEAKGPKVAHLPKGVTVWRHKVSGSDCQPVYIDETIECFRDDNAKGLAGKPKLFFIQACRSRHGGKLEEKYDFGQNIKVASDASKNNVQPSDAGDNGNGAVFDDLDMRDIEDVNQSWIDKDEDEWNSDIESESEDNEDLDSDSDFTDAKGAPDSGRMPPSPQPDPIEETKESENAELSGDECDAGHSNDTDTLLPLEYDMVPINCPNDCLLVYPVMSGGVAFRHKAIGSRLLHCMEDNLQMLVQGCDLLHYLTHVSAAMARIDIKPGLGDKYTKSEIIYLRANMPFKVTANIMHRLQAKVQFKPKSKKSLMSWVLNRFK